MAKNFVGLSMDQQTPETYNGGMCKCGHSAMAHSAQGHFRKDWWQCWRGKWVKRGKTFLLTSLPCPWHKFKPVAGK